ncbi:hypothetical protein LJC09_04520, partial [Desulfovibrio sp. OttesenSCG-928-F20]|nr:hypothetical protein [Desulfovibrio sp. OttesenSCG-928-F20]
VAELRTVGGSRHEFVDRENRIILEYKATSNFRIEYIGKSGANTFRFRIINGFGEFIAGKTVQVSAGGGVNLAAAPASEENASLFAQALNFIDELFSVSTAHAAASVTKITNSRGEFDVTITSPITGQITLTASIDGAEASVTVGVEASTPGIQVSVGTFSGSGASNMATATLKLNAFDSQGNPVSGENVTWTVTVSSSSAAAVTAAFKSSLAGLELVGNGQGRLMPTNPGTGNTPAPNTVPLVTPVDKDISSSVTLTDIVGQRKVTVQATVLIDGSFQIFTADVQFGNGPLYEFRFPKGSNEPGVAQWANDRPIDAATSLPAAELCGNNIPAAIFTSWSAGDYSSQTGLPTRGELRTVATGTGNEAWKAAGWPHAYYWTGELVFTDYAWTVVVADGSHVSAGALGNSYRVVCRR